MTVLNVITKSKAIHLQNKTCPYCGISFSEAIKPEKEHVIGRRFVPKGTLDGQWNLLVRSCQTCNQQKAKLENDISAITMQPDAAGKFVSDDPRLHAEAERKARNAISHKTGKAVAIGEKPLEISSQFGPIALRLSLIMPPQVHDKRLFDLARFHVAAFFYMITFNYETGFGGFLNGAFGPLGAARKADWGNTHMRWFMKTTETWLWRVCAISADGNFKIAIKRQAEDQDIWSWALEWNGNFRLIGFWGQSNLITTLWSIVPELKMISVSNDPRQSIRMRYDVALDPAVDTLFSVPDIEAAAIASPVSLG